MISIDKTLRPVFRRLSVLAVAAFVLGIAAPAPSGAVESKSIGVGLEARTPHPEFPLKLVFSTYEGPLVVDVQVSIWNSDGDLVLSSDDNAGPWLFVDLQPGQYAVRAWRSDSAATSANIQVPEEGQSTVILSFPSAEQG